MTKQAIRLELLNKRKRLSLSEVNNQSAIITAKILKLNIFNKDDLVVGLYYPVNNEVDMLPLWHVLLERKVVCAFPKVVSKNTMHFYSMAEGDLWEKRRVW